MQPSSSLSTAEFVPFWKPLLAVCFALFFLTGCGDARMQRLCGTWKLDIPKSESLVDNLLDGESPEDSLAGSLLKEAGKAVMEHAADQAKAALSQTMILKFNSDGTWSSETGFANAKGKKSGKWKVLSETGDLLTIQFDWTESNSNMTEKGQTSVRFNSHNSITLVPPNIAGTEMELTFRRDPAK